MKICGTHSKLKKISNICDFDRIFKSGNCRIKNFDDFKRYEADKYLWRAGLLNVKEKRMTIRYITNWCLVKFLREGKANVF